jgi:hypothetical protein
MGRDIRITFYDHDEFPVPRDEKMFFLWFHTGAAPGLRFALLALQLSAASASVLARTWRRQRW